MWLGTNLLIPSRRVPSSTVNIKRNLPARGARYSLPVSMMTPARVKRWESLFSASHSSPLTSSRLRWCDKLSHTKRPALLLTVSVRLSHWPGRALPFFVIVNTGFFQEGLSQDTARVQSGSRLCQKLVHKRFILKKLGSQVHGQLRRRGESARESL